jgi:hypothetical protein
MLGGAAWVRGRIIRDVRAALTAALLLLAAPGPAAQAKTLNQPVAVMPFKNLSDDGALDWMSKGIAETMVSDLRQGGRVKVVERDQLDRALSELLLQDAKPGEDSTAAQLGRMWAPRRWWWAATRRPARSCASTPASSRWRPAWCWTRRRRRAR